MDDDDEFFLYNFTVSVLSRSREVIWRSDDEMRQIYSLPVIEKVEEEAYAKISVSEK